MCSLLEKCCKLAEEEGYGKYRIGAIITDSKGSILSKGTNSYIKTHPLQAFWAAEVGEARRVFRHAEIHAISRIPKDSRPYAIYIGRINRDGTSAIARPCRICERAIKESGIREVHYTL
jgi:tRNA(Arg) A34 adenosine deaminase TadA